MSDQTEDIADALVTFVQGLADESPPISMIADVRKTDNPLGELSGEIGNLTVLFHGMEEEEELLTRGGTSRQLYTVAMLVARKLTTEMTREKLAGYVTELKNAIRGISMAGYAYNEQRQAVKYDPVQRLELGQFLSVVHFTYAGFA